MTSIDTLPVVESVLKLSGQKYEDIRKQWHPVLAEFKNALREVSTQGDDKSCHRYQERGQLLGRHADRTLRMRSDVSGSSRQNSTSP